MRILYSARTHIGKVRERNEDNLFADGTTLPFDICSRPFSIDGCANAPAVFAVCDGMGGEEDGEAASRLAVEMLSVHQERMQQAKRRLLDGEVQSYIKSTSQAITRRAGGGKRAGTTLALAVISKHGIHCYNVGDSRIYCRKRNEFGQVTNDHTVASELMRGIREADPDTDKRLAHRLTRCIGIGSAQVAEQYPALTGRCRLLICSDGLTNMVGADEIGQILHRFSQTSQAADALLDEALKRGGRDNVTVIVTDVEPFRGPRFVRRISGFLPGSEMIGK